MVRLYKNQIFRIFYLLPNNEPGRLCGWEGTFLLADFVDLLTRFR